MMKKSKMLKLPIVAWWWSAPVITIVSATVTAVVVTVSAIVFPWWDIPWGIGLK